MQKSFACSYNSETEMQKADQYIICYQTLSIQSADYVIFDNMPVVSDNRPVESDNMPVESDNMPVESDNMPVDSDNMPVHCSS